MIVLVYNHVKNVWKKVSIDSKTGNFTEIESGLDYPEKEIMEFRKKLKSQEPDILSQKSVPKLEVIEFSKTNELFYYYLCGVNISKIQNSPKISAHIKFESRYYSIFMNLPSSSSREARENDEVNLAPKKIRNSVTPPSKNKKFEVSARLYAPKGVIRQKHPSSIRQPSRDDSKSTSVTKSTISTARPSQQTVGRSVSKSESLWKAVEGRRPVLTYKDYRLRKERGALVADSKHTTLADAGFPNRTSVDASTKNLSRSAKKQRGFILCVHLLHVFRGSQLPSWRLMFEETIEQKSKFLQKEVWLTQAEKCIARNLKETGDQATFHFDDKENQNTVNQMGFSSFSGSVMLEKSEETSPRSHREISNLTYSNFVRPESRELARKRSDRQFVEQRTLIARSIEEAFERHGFDDVVD